MNLNLGVEENKKHIWVINNPPTQNIFKTHMVQTRPHHVKLVHEFFVQGTHLRVHQLLVHGQPHSEDVNLQQRVRQSRVRSSACSEDELCRCH